MNLMSGHDRYLAAYRRTTITVWCANTECPNSDPAGVDVTLESEYGQSWIDPEVCPICNGELLDDPPKEEDE